MVYDIDPKLRIPGSGFDTIDVSTLKLSFAPKLVQDEDYTVQVASDAALLLTLKPDKK